MDIVCMVWNNSGTNRLDFGGSPFWIRIQNF